jgi:hypothetical protein
MGAALLHHLHLLIDCMHHRHFGYTLQSLQSFSLIIALTHLCCIGHVSSYGCHISL